MRTKEQNEKQLSVVVETVQDLFANQTNSADNNTVKIALSHDTGPAKLPTETR